MYKVLDVSISGFWQKFGVQCQFRDDVNIVIGKNGTGKTTFMNILHAILSVDPDVLFENDFKSAAVRLIYKKSTKTVKVEKQEFESSQFPVAVYQISQKKYAIPLVGPDAHPVHRRRAADAAQDVKRELGNLVSLASLSVYRIGTDVDAEPRERIPRKVLSPVDLRLTTLMQRLTHYQLELSTEARKISSNLQRDVLMSLLYRPETEQDVGYALEFDENQERQSLISAYKQLGLSGSDVTKRIQDHVNAIVASVKAVKNSINASKLEPNKSVRLDFAPLEARKRTRRVVDMSLQAEAQTKDIFSQVDLFLMTLRDFISDKKFSFNGGDLTIDKNGVFPIAKLSSGEKQLLILLIETLLQKQNPYIFLADEPELSLHIAWQRQIISAIKALNPKAQIIVATHSPEVAGRFKETILDMEDLLHV
ncbi:AAA family ATPase [Burkholderia gladioli]|uniref:AAA family ATPase n=1 Tax=Burkholderia gladioli TaxID=28095 RepID=UPI000BF061E3|nr:AAA family ATPase [Burkholderia gladioli]PEH86355.1 ABC transporter ATP-binding protein [Burkholderia gladioli]